MFCHKCGNKIEDGSESCGKCGEKVVVETAKEQEGDKYKESTPANAGDQKREKWTIPNLWRGRIPRLHYFFGHSLIILPLLTIWGLTALGGTLSDSLSSLTMTNIFTTLIFVLIALLALLTLAYIPIGICLAVRRCHDFGTTGWLTLTMFIPYIGFIFGLYILFKGGDGESNKYGPMRTRKFIADVFNYS